MLYLSVGDGGGANDQFDLTRNRDTAHGKILRLDVSPDVGWNIPADNPIIAGQRDAVWAIGLRNPWRMVYDQRLQRWWVADVGQNSKEEVSLLTAADDAGWPFFEGTQRRAATSLSTTAPTFCYGPEFGRSIIGGALVAD